MSEVRDIVKSLGNRLVFMSSHLLAEVTEVCQEVALIDHGKLIVYDTLANVSAKFSGTGSAVEVRFARDVDQTVSGRLGGLAGVQSVTKLNERQVRIKYDSTLTSQQRLFEEVAGLKVGALSLDAASGLEEAYLSLVKETL